MREYQSLTQRPISLAEALIHRDLADIRKEGKLTREEFAVAMHLINDKLAGKPLPSTLPMSTVPPGLRSQVAAQSGTGESDATHAISAIYHCYVTRRSTNSRPPRRVWRLATCYGDPTTTAIVLL